MALILIVEDDPTTAFIQTSLLEKLGLAVHVVSRGDEAVEKIRDLKPDIIVLDLILPGKKGTEILREMSEDSTLKNIPVVVCSGSVDRNDPVFKEYNEIYRRHRSDELVYVNKIPQGRKTEHLELPEALYRMLAKAGLPVPPKLKEWNQLK